MQNFLFKEKLSDQLIVLFTLIFAIIVWWLIFGWNLSNEPYIWDDLHFFREYTKEELKNIWIGNWDSDGIETPSYRPIAVLYYHCLYIVFEENTFSLRNFVILESLVLVLISCSLLKKLNFNKNSILIFLILIIFSKIYITLISWFTISVLLFAYIFSISSILFFLLSIEKKNKIYYFLSITFASIAILTREELYILPVVKFLFFFYKYEINFKNFSNGLIKVSPFFLIVFLHMILRKIFIPDADHLQITGFLIKYGENFLNVGGFVKAFKSSFLPMGYLSSSYSTFFQSITAWIWIISLFFSVVILIFKTENNKDNLKKNLILCLIILVCCLPHLTIARSFGIYLSSFLGLALVANLIDSLFKLIKDKNQNFSFIYYSLICAILFSGIIGGIYRSVEHAKSMSQYSKSIIEYDSLFIYGYKNENTRVSIPLKRYLVKEQHLKNLGINNYHWGKNIEINSNKLIKNHYEPLSF